MDQRIGKKLGSYKIVEVIAKGTFGIVYRAEHIHLGHSVAIKFIHAYLNTPQQQASFRQEAQMLVTLKHSNIVRLLDFDIEDDTPYLVSEYAPGGSLRAYLDQQTSLPIPLQDAFHILTWVGRALIYVHSQKVIHRDLKPENILFGNDGRALLADFGIARVKRTISTSGSGSVGSLKGLGTPPYMAPEQFTSKGEPLPQSDQYALGCIAYELLTGQLPFTADNEYAYMFQHLSEPPPSLRQLNPHLSLRVEQAVLTALAKDPAARHTNVEAFLVALGIRQSASTQVDLSSDTTVIADAPGTWNPDNATPIMPTLTEGEIKTELSPRRLASTQQFASMPIRSTSPMQSAPIPTTIRSAFPPFQTTGPTQHTIPPAVSKGTAATKRVLSVWKRLRDLVAGASALTIAKWLFLLIALIDAPLLLSGFWFGPGVLVQIGTVFAVFIFICGLALNFFTEPWYWLVLFLLLSPLSGGWYVFVVTVIQGNRGIIDWRTYCGYLLLIPVVGLLYGLFGPTRRRDESITPSFTKVLTLVIWVLGACLLLVSFIAPAVIYIGLAWMLASGILAAAQVIRLKQWDTLVGWGMASAMTLGVPLLFFGFYYGAFGPITENQKPFGNF